MTNQYKLSSLGGTPKQRKHILFLTDSMEGGGAERLTLELLQSLSDSEYEKSLCLLRPSGSLLEDVPASVTVLDLSGIAKWKNIFQAAHRIRQVVKLRKVDLIISSLTQSNCVLMRVSPFLPTGLPLILTVQNNLSLNIERRYERKWKRWCKTAEIRLLYNRANAVVTVSRGLKKDMQEWFGIASSRLTVIHNLVDVEAVQAKAQRPVLDTWITDERKKNWPMLVAVGRLVEQKRFDQLLEAFAQLRASQPVRLVILGKGPLMADLEQQARELEIDDDVYFAGFVNNPWSVMKRADLFVSSSHWEGFSLAHLEAMACGTPLVLTDCDYGPRELITHGQNGVLVPVGDPIALCNAIARLLGNPAQRKALSSAALTYVQQFDRAAVVAKYDRLFRAMLEPNNSDMIDQSQVQAQVDP
jgi:glycosyltransferase involved in cell wall biosynthesis